MTVNDEVILSVLKLSRAMRRCPPEHGEESFPPAVGRLLESACDHDGVTSRELCELLDLRPSSLSELMARAEAQGLLLRVADEEDHRIQHVTLTESGKETVQRMRAVREADAAKKAACFTDAEKETFIALCAKLGRHLESIAPAGPVPGDHPPFPPHGMPGHPHRPPHRKPVGAPEGFFPQEKPDDAPEGRFPLDRIRC